MSKREKLISKAKRTPKGLRYDEACKLAEIIGFEHTGGSGSHKVYTRDDIQEIINIQEGRDGMAKAYQVKQILEIMEEYNLE